MLYDRGLVSFPFEVLVGVAEIRMPVDLRLLFPRLQSSMSTASNLIATASGVMMYRNYNDTQKRLSYEMGILRDYTSRCMITYPVTSADAVRGQLPEPIGLSS